MKKLFQKFNWGWGIGLFYTAFVVFMLGMVYKASQNSIDFVTTDYYKKELEYQAHIDKIKRTAMLAEKPKWQVQEKRVVVSFPVKETGKDVKANVLFYRPSDSGKDVTINVTADSTGQAIVTSDKLQHGVYRMQIDWEAGSTSYYTEGIVNLN